MNLLEEALTVLHALEAAKIDHALVGGLAVGIYTAPRATRDIDLVFRQADWPRIAEILAPLGFELLDPKTIGLAGGALEMRRLIKCVPGAEDVLILDLLPDSFPPAKEALDDRVAIPELKICVGSIEGLIKLKAARASGQDLLDIAALRNVTHEA